MIWRANEDAPWAPLHEFDCHGIGPYPTVIGWDGRTGYLPRLTAYGTWGLATYDLVSRTLRP